MALGGNRSVGLDIADTSIEVVELTERGKGYQVAKAGRINLEPGVVEYGRIKNEEKLTKLINELFAKTKLKATKLVFGLSENQVFTHIFKLAGSDKKDREQLVLEEARNNIPLKEDDLLFSYAVLEEKTNEIEILLVAVNKQVFLEWQNWFKKLNIEVQFDIESLAIIRGLFLGRPKEPVGVVDMGTFSSNLSIADEQGLKFGFVSKVGGHSLTSEIAKELKIDYLEAEKIKMEQGLKDKNGQVYKVISKLLQPLVNDFHSSLGYFKERTGKEVVNISLVGGGSKLSGLVDYLNPQFEIDVKLGESPLLTDKSGLEYVVAAGLALKGYNRLEDQRDPVLRLRSGAPSALSKSVGEVIKKQEQPAAEILEEEGKEKGKKPVLATPEEIADLNKLKRQKRILMLVIAVGVLVILGAVWYRYDQNNRRQVLMKAQEVERDKKPEEQVKKSEENKDEEVSDGTEAGVEEIVTEGESLGRLVVGDTPTGWLSVRAGPGTNYERISQVDPGEEYDYFEESEAWLRISVDGSEGWVHGDYVEVIAQ